MKRFEIQWTAENGNEKTFAASFGENLLDVCRRMQVPLDAACNGNGVCGKCGIQVLEGNAPITEADRGVFSKKELADGYRLACQVEVTGSLRCREIAGSQSMQIQTPMPLVLSVAGDGCAPGYGIAVDLGSTTLAAVLVDADGRAISQATAVNSQRAYGADVISRIQSSNEGKQKELQTCICRDLEQLFRVLLEGAKEVCQVFRIAIAGNTAMLHLLRGYSCKTLGAAPFQPVNLGLETLDYGELFEEVSGCEDSTVCLLPGLSAFIGADIAAGLYSSGFWQTPEDQLAFFIDLGTNGELVFGNRAGFVTASAAAGPAFEGGGLSCGVPGIPGAICDVSYLYHRVRIRTIGQKTPCGICGTGALAALAALLQEGKMDADGLLAPELFETGLVLGKKKDGRAICLTQADIRQLQMAKAAVRAGIEVLRTPGLVDAVYLAGGFGYYLDPDTAAAVGLFPKEWKAKTVVCGNASLKGAIAFLSDPGCGRELAEICAKGKEVRLADDPYFQDAYVSQMGFSL